MTQQSPNTILTPEEKQDVQQEMQKALRVTLPPVSYTHLTLPTKA